MGHRERINNMPAAKKNKVLKDHGAWLEIDVSTPAFPEAIMKIDRDDWDMLQGAGMRRVGCIRPNGDKYTTYARARMPKTSHKAVHRLIHPDSQSVDHLNGDGLDNRRENLYPCTQHENMRNIKGGVSRKDYVRISHVRATGEWVLDMQATCGTHEECREAAEAILNIITHHG
jgi:hypothetical protein